MNESDFVLQKNSDGSISLAYDGVIFLHLDKNNPNKSYIHSSSIGYRPLRRNSYRIDKKKKKFMKRIERIKPLFFWRRKFAVDNIDSYIGRYVITDAFQENGDTYLKGYFIYENCLKGVVMYVKPLKFYASTIKGR